MQGAHCDLSCAATCAQVYPLTTGCRCRVFRFVNVLFVWVTLSNVRNTYDELAGHTVQNVNYACVLQGDQAGKHVCRESRQVVVVKVELPVGEEGETRSGSHNVLKKSQRIQMW